MEQQVSAAYAALELRAAKQIAAKTNVPTKAMTFCVVAAVVDVDAVLLLTARALKDLQRQDCSSFFLESLWQLPIALT